MSDKHSVRNGIIVGLSVAAILAVVSQIPLIFTAVKAGLGFVFGLLGTDFTISMWLLGIVLSVAAILIKRRIDRWIDGPRELVEQTSTAESVERVVERVQESNEPELDEVQQDIMKAFAYADTNTFSIGKLYDSVPFTRLILDQAVGRLQELGFLERAMIRGDSYILTGAGTDYIIAQGWAVLR